MKVVLEACHRLIDILPTCCTMDQWEIRSSSGRFLSAPDTAGQLIIRKPCACFVNSCSERALILRTHFGPRQSLRGWRHSVICKLGWAHARFRNRRFSAVMMTAGVEWNLTSISCTCFTPTDARYTKRHHPFSTAKTSKLGYCGSASPPRANSLGSERYRILCSITCPLRSDEMSRRRTIIQCVGMLVS